MSTEPRIPTPQEVAETRKNSRALFDKLVEQILHSMHSELHTRVEDSLTAYIPHMTSVLETVDFPFPISFHFVMCKWKVDDIRREDVNFIMAALSRIIVKPFSRKGWKVSLSMQRVPFELGLQSHLCYIGGTAGLSTRECHAYEHFASVTLSPENSLRI